MDNPLSIIQIDVNHRILIFNNRLDPVAQRKNETDRIDGSVLGKHRPGDGDPRYPISTQKIPS